MEHALQEMATGDPHQEVAATTADRDRSTMMFGRFVVLPTARTLLCEGHPVEVGARAFDLLVVLLASRGQVVSKEAIITFVWPTTTVDESNLRFQMAVLRKALGPERELIKTIPGRGYLLADEIADNVHSLPSALSVPRAADDSHQQQIVQDALSAFVRAISQHPAAVTRLEEILSIEMSLARSHPSDMLQGADCVPGR